MDNPSTKNISQSITLIGMMGVGKTTFGKKLASKLSMPFYDLDHEIESEIGHSVSWIFENAGEKEFRKLETKKLKELSKSLNTKQFDNLQTLTNTLKQLSSQGQLDPNILSNKQELITTTTDTLLQLKSEIFSNGNIANKQNLLNQIDTLLQSKDIFSQNNSFGIKYFSI